jgi:hypothetical protein
MCKRRLKVVARTLEQDLLEMLSALTKFCSLCVLVQFIMCKRAITDVLVFSVYPGVGGLCVATLVCIEHLQSD